MKENSARKRILWITRTGVLTALLIVLQWATSATQAFAGQYITGSCVNAVLAIAVLTCGIWSGITVAVLSPFCAFMVGVGPKLVQIVPGVAVGNAVFVLVLFSAIGMTKRPLWRQAAGLGAAALAKFGALYLVVVKGIVPAMAAGLKPPQIAAFSAMFSWPQMVTAAIGGIAALAMLPLLRKALGSQ